MLNKDSLASKMRYEMTEASTQEMDINASCAQSKSRKSIVYELCLVCKTFRLVASNKNSNEHEDYPRSIPNYANGQSSHNEYYNPAECCENKAYTQQCSSQYQLYNQIVSKTPFSEYGYSGRTEAPPEHTGVSWIKTRQAGFVLMFWV